MFASLARKTPANAYAFLVLTMLFWAGNHVIGKWADGHIPPMTLAFFRWMGAALLMLPLARAALVQDWQTVRHSWPMLLLLGVLGSGLYTTLQYIALTHTDVTSSSILNSWAPVVIAAAGAIIFSDKLRASQMAGLALSLCGVLAIVLRGDITMLATLQFNRGDLIMVLATLIWATYTTLLRLRPAISTASFAAITFTIAAFVNLPLAVWEYAEGARVAWSWGVVAAIAYTVLPASLVGYFLYARAVEIVGATRTGAFIHFIPLFASLMAIGLLGERPALYHLVGFTAILAGVTLASRGGGDATATAAASLKAGTGSTLPPAT